MEKFSPDLPASAKNGVPNYDVDLFSDAVIRDPFKHYAEIRRLGPVVWLPQNGTYVVGRFDEVTAVLRTPKVFSSARGLSLQQKVNDILVGSTLNSDPPEHDLTRSVTSAPLVPGALTEHHNRIAAAADSLIEQLVKRGSFDAVTDLAYHLPVTIVAELVGLPDTGRERLLDWASATFNLFGPDNQRSRDAFADLKSLREFLSIYGQPDKLKPGGWAKRIFDVGPQNGIELATCAQLMRDYINPSLDTTISATGQAIYLFAKHPEQWEKVRANPLLISNAIEEIIRLSTPIRAFTRFIANETVLAGVKLPAGERILVVYASANRDERKFENPNEFDVTRDVHDHVGFGHGVHMCMGMHLARIEIHALLKALARRVGQFILTDEPTVAMNNTIRAFATLPVKVHRVPAAQATDRVETGPLPTVSGHWVRATVTGRRALTDHVVELTLTPDTPIDQRLIRPGAHIDLEVGPGQVRQYSLTGNLNSEQKAGLRIAVLLNPSGRVSPVVHNQLFTGMQVRVSAPRNHFRLDETASQTLLFAGGIGITPLLAMAFRLDFLGKPFHLHYRVRAANQIAYTRELAELGPNVTISCSDTVPSPSVSYSDELTQRTESDHLYVCGPDRYMTAVCNAARAANWPDQAIHTEHFGAEIDTNGDVFTVVCARSGHELQVLPGETIAQNLLQAGLGVPMSCQSGICGTCLTPVLEGRPDHRDLVLTDAEKAMNNQITVCCSRSQSRQLVLDI